MTEEIEVLILDEFLKGGNNTVPAIAKRLDVKENTVSKTINKYIDNLKEDV